MPRARSPNRDRAFELWIESEGQRELKDIASELNVSPEQVRKWKHADNWDAKTQKVTLPNGKGNVTKRKRGGQPGNNNAVGNSGGAAPPGNKNGLKHGAYEKVMLEYLDTDEKEIFEAEDTGDDVELELRQTLAALNVKEIRLMKRIRQVKTSAGKGTLILDSVSSTVSELQKGLIQKGKSKGSKPTSFKGERLESTVTNTVSVFDALEKLERELDRVQGRKIKALSQIESIRVNRTRLEMEKQRIDGEREKNKAADAWISALTGVAMEDENDISKAD